MQSPSTETATLDQDAWALHDALSELVRVYQFRDRKQICYYDVSVTQCYALNALLSRGSLNLTQLASDLYLDKSTASRVVDALVRKGYATRSTDPGDGRAIRLEPTAAGRGLHERIQQDLVDEMKLLVADLDREVRQAAADLIARLARAAAARSTRPSAPCRGAPASRERPGTATVLRPARTADLDSVKRIVGSLDLPWEGVEEHIGSTFCVAVADQQVIGVAGVEVHGAMGLLRSVAVTPEWQGRGLGDALVRDRLSWAEARGLETIYLLTIDASEYFSRFGFQAIDRDRTPDEIQGSGEFSRLCPANAVVMVRRPARSNRRRAEGC